MALFAFAIMVGTLVALGLALRAYGLALHAHTRLDSLRYPHAPAGDLTAPVDPDAHRLRLESLEARIAALESRTTRTLQEARDAQPWYQPPPRPAGRSDQPEEARVDPPVA